MEKIRGKFNWDTIGITASLACAIHCALLPLFLTSLPVLGIEIIDNFLFENIMIGFALAIGSYSLYHGVKKHHHKWWPIVIFSLGICCLVLKQLFHQYQFWLLGPGVLCIIIAHYLNYKFCKKANHCHANDCNHEG